MKSIDRILKCVDFIYHMEMLGGEPFLYKHLPAVMEKLAQTDRIFQIDVITNGTVLPDKRLVPLLIRDNICVVVNDYGAISTKKDALLSLLNNAGIKSRMNKHWAWADLGGFAPRHRTETQLTALFQQCNFKACAELLHGKLYRCPRSSHGTNTGLVPRDDNDYVKVCDESINVPELQGRIRHLFEDKKFLSACDYCDGNTSVSLMLEPAEQIVRTNGRVE